MKTLTVVLLLLLASPSLGYMFPRPFFGHSPFLGGFRSPFFGGRGLYNRGYNRGYNNYDRYDGYDRYDRRDRFDGYDRRDPLYDMLDAVVSRRINGATPQQAGAPAQSGAQTMGVAPAPAATQQHSAAPLY